MLRKDKACRLTAKLVEKGLTVFCPIAYGSAWREQLTVEWNHAEWLRFDLRFLAMSSLLIVADMEGWKESRGVTEEIDFAAKHRIPRMLMEHGQIAALLR
jgi:hypothetical protein